MKAKSNHVGRAIQNQEVLAMKTYLKMFIAIIVACAAFAITGNAQTSASHTMRARIPFTFAVGDKTLAAGVYTVSILNPASDRQALQIRSEDGHVSAIVQTLRVNDASGDKAKIVFRRYGDSYFFANAQLAGESTSLAATKTRAERATQRALRQRGNGIAVAITAE
jgi:hypothetical protein